MHPNRMSMLIHLILETLHRTAKKVLSSDAHLGYLGPLSAITFNNTAYRVAQKVSFCHFETSAE